MSDLMFQIPPFFDYGATFAWAASGAVVGIRKGFDIVGVFIIAMLSSVGGGLIRDGFLLQRMSPVLSDGTYLLLIALATVAMSVFAGWLDRLEQTDAVEKIVNVIDAVGIPAFAVVGMQLSMAQGLPYPAVMLVGVVNGVGGGLLRDVMVGDVPTVLRPGQFSTLSLILVCGFFLVLERQYGVTPLRAAWSTVALFFVIRVLTVRFRWRSRSVLGPPPATADGPSRLT